MSNLEDRLPEIRADYACAGRVLADAHSAMLVVASIRNARRAAEIRRIAAACGGRLTPTELREKLKDLA